jgi:hypothetical protein
MTVLVANDGIITSISILTVDIRRMIKFDLYNLLDGLREEVKWTLVIHLQLLTLSALQLDRIHHLPHPLPHENDTNCLLEGSQENPNALCRIQSCGDPKLLLCCPLLIE